jgi:hypothetical protein
MPERFDELLSGAADSASSAAREPGAAAARQRGGRRRTRRRVAACALSLAVLGLLGGVAAAGAHGSNRLPTAHPAGTPSLGRSASVAASPPASASPSPTSPASTTVTPSSTTPSSTALGSTPPTSVSPGSTPPGSAPVTENWLTAAQIPFVSTMHWSAAAPEHCTGQLEFNSVYAGGCVEHAAFQDSIPATAMDTVVYTATDAPTEAGAWATPLASQAFYTYPSAADAGQAFNTITQDILSSNGTTAGLSIDNLPVTVTAVTTAQTTDALAIDTKMRESNGDPAQINGNLSPASDRHYYFAIKGDVLEVLAIWGGPSISDSTNDAAILGTVAGALG